MGAVVLALLGGLSGAVLAQSESPDEDITWPKLTGFLESGGDAKHIIHVYEPEPRAEPRPAALSFHGGGLVYGQPFQDAEWAQWVAEQGYVTFMAGYRLFSADDTRRSANERLHLRATPVIRVDSSTGVR